MRWEANETCTGERRGVRGFSLIDLREIDDLKDTCVVGRIILKWILKKKDGGFDCVDTAQYRDKWRAVVNAVMNLRFP